MFVTSHDVNYVLGFIKEDAVLVSNYVRVHRSDGGAKVEKDPK